MFPPAGVFGTAGDEVVECLRNGALGIFLRLV